MKYEQPYGVSDVNAPYINGNPAAGIQGSIPPAAAFEYHQRELIQLITQAGFTPSDSDLSQVTKAVRQGVNYFAASGTANALTIAPALPLDAYKAGLRFNVKVNAANTGPVTLQVGSLAAVPIVKPNGAALVAGDLYANMIAGLIYDGASFQVENYGGGGGTGTVNNYTTNIPYCVATGTANAIQATFAPAITALVDGNPFEIKIVANNTGPVTVAINALAPIPLLNLHGIPLVPGDIVTGEVALVIYVGGTLQIINVSGNTRPLMTAPRDYYVNASTGNDTTNNGLSAGTPFATITKALSTMSQWDNNGFDVTIHIADGTYAPFVLPRMTGSGGCYIIGNQALPQNVIISDTSANTPGTGAVMAYGDVGHYVMSGFKVQSTNNNGFGFGAAILAAFNIEFGACGYCHIYNISGSIVRLSHPANPTMVANPFWRITGGCQAHIYCMDKGIVTTDAGPGVDMVVAAPVNVGTWSALGRLSIDNEYYHAVSGIPNVSGAKYNVTLNSVLTGSANIPAPAGGLAASGAQVS
jgi:hypothetical protein